MLTWIIQGNTKFDKEFANLPYEVQIELHSMMFSVVTNSNLEKFDFIHRVTGTDLYFFSTKDEKFSIAFEILPFNILQFLVCFSM